MRTREIFFMLWCALPFGRIIRFKYGNERITLKKDLWIVIDQGKGTSCDAIPITLVSESLAKKIDAEIKSKYGLS